MRTVSYKGRQKYYVDEVVGVAVKNLTDNGDFSHFIGGTERC